MKKRYGILQKKLKELEFKLNQFLSLQPDHDRTLCSNQGLFQDIQQRFLFLKNLLSAEIVCSPRKPYHLQHIAQRLIQLEDAFNNCHCFQTLPSIQHVGNSCAQSNCLNDDGEVAEGQGSSSSDLINYDVLEQAAEEAASTDLMSLAGLDFEGSEEEEEEEVVPVHVGNLDHESGRPIDETEQRKLEEEEKKEEERGKRRSKEETNMVWLGKCLGILGSGVMVGVVMMGYFMARFSGCCHCYSATASDNTFCLTPT